MAAENPLGSLRPLARFKIAPLQNDANLDQPQADMPRRYSRKSGGTKYKKHCKNPMRGNHLESLVFSSGTCV
jgi:hypothetical protein